MEVGILAGEVLSQSEIDSLLSALSTGEMDADELKKEQNEKKVRVYDFKRALRFSKDQIRSLTRIHENFARLLTTFFSAQLRTYVEITVASADQIPYEEFIRSIPNMTILNVFEVPPLEGRIIMEINPNVAYTMLDRLLGGRGNSINKIHNLTEIETKIMSNTFEKAIENLREAWLDLEEIEPMLTGFEVNPQFLQMVSPNETVVVISLNTIIGDTSGLINICIPHIVLEPIMPKLSVHYWIQAAEQKEKQPKEKAIIEKSIQKADLPITVELGASDISIQEFLTLVAGDVIQLNTPIIKPLQMKVSGLPKFIVQPGKVNKKLAIQILETLEEGEEHDE
jgi:flagellar motor switch protein FliM